MPAILCSFGTNNFPLCNLTPKLNPVLKELELRDNQFKEVPDLACFTNLRHLELSYNEIRSLAPLASLIAPQLNELYAASNKITAIEGITQLAGLTLLELGSNRIRAIEASRKDCLKAVSTSALNALDAQPAASARCNNHYVHPSMPHVSGSGHAEKPAGALAGAQPHCRDWAGLGNAKCKPTAAQLAEQPPRIANWPRGLHCAGGAVSCRNGCDLLYYYLLYIAAAAIEGAQQPCPIT